MVEDEQELVYDLSISAIFSDLERLITSPISRARHYSMLRI